MASKAIEPKQLYPVLKALASLSTGGGRGFVLAGSGDVKEFQAELRSMVDAAGGATSAEQFTTAAQREPGPQHGAITELTVTYTKDYYSVTIRYEDGSVFINSYPRT